MGLSRNHFQLNNGRSPVRSRLRSFSSRRSTHPSTILIDQSPWRPTIARDAGGRWSVPASPRPGNGHVKPSGGPVIRPSPTSHATPVPSVRTGGVGIHPQSNAGLWRIVHLVLPGVKLLVRVRRVGGGDPQLSGYQPSGLAIPEHQPSGLAIAMVETLRHRSDGIRNAVSASTRGRPRRRRAGRRRQT